MRTEYPDSHPVFYNGTEFKMAELAMLIRLLLLMPHWWVETFIRKFYFDGGEQEKVLGVYWRLRGAANAKQREAIKESEKDFKKET
jgi:hypothetical protein